MYKIIKWKERKKNIIKKKRKNNNNKKKWEVKLLNSNGNPMLILEIFFRFFLERKKKTNIKWTNSLTMRLKKYNNNNKN